MKLFKRLFDTAEPPQFNAEDPEEMPASFAAAIEAIDRAAREHQAQGERHLVDRRVGAPDTRPAGAPERRSGIDRRSGPAQSFGRRRATA